MKVWNTRQVKFANFEPVLYANSHLAKIMGGSVHQPSLCQIGSIFVIHKYRARERRIYPRMPMGIYSASTRYPAPTFGISSKFVLGNA